MSLTLTHEQEMVGGEVRKILAGAGDVAHLRRIRDEGPLTGYSKDLWRQFCENGFAGILIPETKGGAGLGLSEVVVIMQEIGRTLVPLPFLSTSVLTVTTLNLVASEQQKANLFQRIIAGDAVVAFAIDERTKHQPEKIEASSTATKDGFVLNGTKSFVIDGSGATHFIVVARSRAASDDEGDIDLFLADATTPGMSISPVRQIDGHTSATLVFRDCKLDRGMRLGRSGDGRRILEIVLRLGRIAVAAELLGIADECLARTVAYLKTRRQFGKPLSAYQALQHRAARQLVEIEITRAALLAAVEAHQELTVQADLLASVAKARAGATASLVVQESVQLHGGMGMTDEIDIGLFMKRAQVLQETFGDRQYHLNRIAEIGKY